MIKAVFLDRDGTINEDRGYVYSSDRLVLIPRSIEALKLLEEEFSLFIVTNQCGIGENVFSQREYLDFNEYFQSLLRDNGIYIKDTYCCPHKKEQRCICRKPKTYFLEKAAKEYDIDIVNSYVVGDHPHDVEMGFRMGAKTVYLLSGHGTRHRDELGAAPDHIEKDLYAASVRILEENR
ncbi:MAG: HAD-IIIA family hydrolase [Candidatus Omnitrophica bacterium]|nr:HAD-IIIA family hydrolase [Candidatus Omnitrophota bacterium]